METLIYHGKLANQIARLAAIVVKILTDLRDTGELQYFAITEFNNTGNCFTPSLLQLREAFLCMS